MQITTVEQVQTIVAEAKAEAEKAAIEYFNVKLDGQDQYACGFAWVNISGVKGNTKLGRLLKQAGIDQNYRREFSIWNPSGVPYQNVDCKYAGARAAAEVFKRHGFDAYADSRLD